MFNTLKKFNAILKLFCYDIQPFVIAFSIFNKMQLFGSTKLLEIDIENK